MWYGLRMANLAPMTVLEETPARFTVEEFMELVKLPPLSDWHGKTELVDGVITRMSPANIPHWNAQRLTFMNLYEAMKDVSGGWIVGQEPAVRLSGDILREPDVAILRDTGLVGEIFDRTALYLAVEIADSSIRIDLGTKLEDYAKAFVPHYWVVDINDREVHVMTNPMGGRYTKKTVIPFGVEIAIPGVDREIIFV